MNYAYCKSITVDFFCSKSFENKTFYFLKFSLKSKSKFPMFGIIGVARRRQGDWGAKLLYTVG